MELWEYLEKNNIKPITQIDKRTEEVKDDNIKTLYDLSFFINNEALNKDDKKEVNEYNSAIISKLVNDFVFGSNITENEFKKLIDKEFKGATKRKEKTMNSIRKTVVSFLDDFEHQKKKAYTILK